MIELIFGVLVGLFILVLLVVVHELGHAIAARRSGVVVEEFGIGFPPRAWARKLKNGVLFTLNWLPLGGFVKLQGEHDSARGKGDYGAASFWQKTKILLAGVVINWLVAAVLLTVLAVTGLPKILPNQFAVQSDTTLVTSPVLVTSFGADSPAQYAGLEVGDGLLTIEGEEITSPEDFRQQVRDNAGETVTIQYVRGGVEATAEVSIREDKPENADAGLIGVGMGQNQYTKATWSAPIVGVATTIQFTVATLQGIGDLIGNIWNGIVLQLSGNEAAREEASKSLEAAGSSVAGPIGILGVIFPQAQQAGLTQLVFLTAIISLTLAVMNILPIPALDGGRWFTMAIFRLIRKPLTKETEDKIQTAGFLFLMGLIILITVADVRKLF